MAQGRTLENGNRFRVRLDFEKMILVTFVVTKVTLRSKTTMFTMHNLQLLNIYVFTLRPLGPLLCPGRQSKQNALFASENTLLGDRLRLLGGDKPRS